MSGHPRTYSIPGEWRAAKMDGVYGLPTPCNVTQMTSSLYFIDLSLAISSFLACAVALLLAFLLRLYKHFTYRLAMYQVVGSLLWEICVVMLSCTELSNHSSMFYQVMCKVVAFLEFFSMSMKLMFTLWLTFHLFCYVVFFKNLKKLEWLYITSSVFLPLLVSWIPFIHNNYGIAGGWCFIRESTDTCTTNTEGIIEIFALFYGPLAVSLIFGVLAIFIMIVVMVSRAYVNSNTQTENEPLLRSTSKTLLKQLLPLLAYPVIYFTLVLIPVTNRIYDAISPTENHGLTMAHGIITAVMGLFAGLAFIVHILCLRRHNRCVQDREESDTARDATVGSSSRISPPSQTRFSLQAESEVDKNM